MLDGYLGRAFCSEVVGGLYYGAREATFEAKASEDSLTGIGGRRDVFVAGRRGSRIN
jgi:hypothetical protein